ncbi:MAG: AI-2E family transporter [Desulfotignum sp.]|nr:AI-2E family transporter [Desulfotignum sp.]
MKKLEQGAFLSMLVLVTAVFFYLLKPFYGAVFWACVIGLLFYPLQQRFVKWWKNRPTLAALSTLLVVITIGVIPTLFVLASFFQEGAALYQRLQSGDINIGQRIEQIRQAFPAVQLLMDRFNLDLGTFTSQLSGAAIAASRFIAQNAVQFGQDAAQWFVSLGLMLYLAFFMLRDGSDLVVLLKRALPLGDERENLLFAKFAEVTRATVKGNLVVAVIQGSLGGIIFWILGIPAALLWGVVMTLLSLIPMVGAGLIWLPVAVYLFATGSWIQGLVLTGFGAGVIGLVDNFLRPVLVGRDTKLPDYLVLLSTLGGFVLFNINGFVIGPLLAALFVAFWEIFIRDFNTPADAE